MFRIGMVGAGAIGKEHQAAIAKNEDCSLTAVCDLDLQKAKELAQGEEVHIYADYKEMLSREELDAVILNLPHFLHKDVSIDCLEHGVPTLVEKPMANSVSECDAMISASQRTGVPLAIGHVQRYYRCYRELKRMVRCGDLGRLCSVTETRNVDYFTNRPKWFLTKEQSGGGILMNYGAHTLDKVMYVTGAVPESITALGSNFLTEDNVEATAQVLVQFSEGVSGAFSYCGCRAPTQYDTYFYFTEGSAWIENGTVLWISHGKEPLQRMELEEESIIECQLREFVKLLRGEPNEMATPQYGRIIVQTLEAAFRQMEA